MTLEDLNDKLGPRPSWQRTQSRNLSVVSP